MFSRFIPAGFVATGLYLVVGGLHSLYTDSGELNQLLLGASKGLLAAGRAGGSCGTGDSCSMNNAGKIE